MILDLSHLRPRLNNDQFKPSAPGIDPARNLDERTLTRDQKMKDIRRYSFAGHESWSQI
jgi:hypothetical protein